MGEVYVNNTSLDMSHDYNNTSNDPEDEKIKFIKYVMICIISCIGIPLTLVAIYALYSLVGKDHVAPIYVINLLISDLIQFCCMIGRVASHEDNTARIISSIYNSSLFASVCFMLCISLERYLVIACPLWYRFRRTIKISVVVCVLIWIISLAIGSTFVFGYFSKIPVTILAIFFLLPLPLLIFFLVGTLKALSASISVPADEKRRIVAMLVLVLVIYTLLFLPRTIRFHIVDMTLYILSYVFIKLSPLADLVLYVFMRKGAIDKLLNSVCCCRMDSNDVSVNDDNMSTVSFM
ncbi:G-protein coupled receptor 4-like [Perca flavescens]|uniref:G-protein coupled receptor 4-like n=1 Tax=Perca flavescens TaxID=8167 RepID=UPI00106EF615|nr:G-protein coupled receptor 4-like [Perca flavescens]